MAQLVGSLCVHCQKRIGSIVEGRFCKSCTSPSHLKCQDLAVGQGIPQGNCPECGCDAAKIKGLSDPERREREQLLQRDRQIRGEAVSQDSGSLVVPGRQHTAASARKYPISRSCPNCRQTRFKSVRPDRLVTFTWDRICSDCGTRYSPPAPEWAVPVFFIAGFLLAGIGCATLFFTWLPAIITSQPKDVCSGASGSIGGFFLLALAIAAIVQGVRAWKWRASEQETNREEIVEEQGVDSRDASDKPESGNEPKI